MVVMGGKLGVDPQIGQSVCCGLGQEPFFLGSSRIYLSLLDQCERFPRMGTTRRKRTIGVHGLAREVYMTC
jgi:hypothetical protein